MRTSSILAIQGIDESCQQVVVLLMIAEADDVNVDFLLLQALRQFHNFPFVSHQRRSDEQNDAHLVVLALAMFQNQLKRFKNSFGVDSAEHVNEPT